MAFSHLPAKIEDMHGTLQEVVELCGLSVAESLYNHFAGQRIWVPNRLSEGHLLRRMGGAEAEKLVAYFGNTSLDVPISLFSPAGRRRIVGQLIATGMAQGEIAAALKMSQRAVSRIENKWFPNARKACCRDSDGYLTGRPENFRTEVAEPMQTAVSGRPERSRLH